MYFMVPQEDVIRIPPDKLSDDIDKIIEPLTKENFEGSIDREGNLLVVVQKVKPIGDGRIVHGDGGVYQRVRFNTLTYRPELHEIVQGTVVEIMKFGAFIRFGPLDGLLHISQIMDDHIDVDMKNDRLIGKETKRELKKGDLIRARIVTVSINERNPRDSKIGLTMRQPGLGKIEWIRDERKKEKESVDGKPAKSRGKKKK